MVMRMIFDSKSIKENLSINDNILKEKIDRKEIFKFKIYGKSLSLYSESKKAFDESLDQ